MTEGGRNRLGDVGLVEVVFYRGVENQSGADNRSWKPAKTRRHC